MPLRGIKKKGVELWGLVSIYKGQKTLKKRYEQLGFESGHTLLQKDRKGYALSSPEGRRAKAHMMAIWQFWSAVPNWLLEAECALVFRCHLVSPSRVFWLVLVPRRVFNLRLWFFVSFLDNLGFSKSNYFEDKYLKINLDKVQIIHNFIVIQSSLLFLCMHPYFKHLLLTNHKIIYLILIA